MPPDGAGPVQIPPSGMVVDRPIRTTASSAALQASGASRGCH